MSWDPSYRFFIPVQLCQYALCENFTASFRLYCYLKGQCSGKMKVSKGDIKTFAADLKCDPKTILNHLKKLRDFNWIGYNTKSKYYFIRAFDVIMEMHGFTSRTGAEFKKSYLHDFKAFTAGAAIGYISNAIRKKQAAERKKHVPNKRLAFPMVIRLRPG
jgi:hypothetical protein